MSLSISTGSPGQARDGQLSPPISGSPSLRGPSTDGDERETSWWSQSSPSTGFSSVDEDAVKPLRPTAPAVVVEGFASGRTSPLNAKILASSAELAHAAANAGRWRFPFAKANPGNAASSSPPNNSGGSKRDRSASGKHAATAIDDGSFVETTSAQAALALARYWNEVKHRESQNGKGKGRATDENDNDYFVFARQEAGKTIYRIRPKARPASVAQPTLDHTKATLQPPSMLPRAPSIRLTRSIPNLRSGAKQSGQSSIVSIHADEDGFYRPDIPLAHTRDSGLLSVPSGASHSGSNDSRSERSRHSSLATSSSIPNMRAERDGDVFSRLLGWSYEMPESSSQARPSVQGSESFHTARTHLTQESVFSNTNTLRPKSRPADLKVGSTWSYAARPPELRTPDMASFPTSGTPPQTIRAQPMVRAATTGRLDSLASTSPFGRGVRLPSSPRLRRRKSMEDLPHILLQETASSPGLEQETMQDLPDTKRDSVPALREVASSETIRTSRQGDETLTFAMAAKLEQEALEVEEDCHTPITAAIPNASVADEGSKLDLRVFDVMYALERSAWRPSSSLSQTGLSVDGSNYRRHRRGTSATSLASTTSLHSSSSMSSANDRAHEITVTAGTGDDPRFVLYGIKQAAGNMQRQPHQTQQLAGSASVASSKVDSPTGSASVTGRRTSISGRRWSNARKGGSLSTPPPSASSAHHTPTSPGIQAPEKVLMAATVERWIAEITSKIEGDLMTDFFMTYRAFLSPMELCKLLQARFEWTLSTTETAEDIAARRVVRVRTYVVIRYWLLNFFVEDFVPERELRVCLTDWLNRMGKDARLRANPTDLRLVKSLKKIVKGYKAKYSTVPVGGPSIATAEGAPTIAIEQQLLSTRVRAGSTASTFSLSSAKDEGQSAGMHLQPSPLIASKPSPAKSSSLVIEEGSGRDRTRTSSSEDDVDLDIEHRADGYDSDEQAVIPAVFPISPQRRINHSPRVVTNPRSPQLDGSTSRSPRMLNQLPNMPEHNRLSKYLTSTMGSFGKLKRIVGNKTSRSGETLEGTVSDLANLRSSETLAYARRDGGLGIRDLGSESTFTLAESDQHLSENVTPSRPDLHHAKSTQTIKRASMNSRNSARSERQHTSEASALQPAFVEKPSSPSVKRQTSMTVQLDDYDSSDDESNYGGTTAVIRKVRRLPAARDLRAAGREGQPYLAHRHSIATLSSYGGGDMSMEVQPIRVPSFATYDSHDSSANDGEHEFAGENVVPFFVPPVDSDDEEPGDVEAALRRLEGQVDQAKQKSNAIKVEMYLQKSEVAKANGGYLQEDAPPVVNDEPTTKTLRVVNGSISSFKDVETPPETGQMLEADQSMPSACAPSNRLSDTQHAQAQEPQAINKVSMEHLAPAAASKSVQRKSSMRRFFGSRSSLAFRSSTTISTVPALAAGTPLHRSFLLDFKSDTLAKHFTIIERDLLNKVSWQELISMQWRKRPDIGEVTSWDAYLKQRARLNAQISNSPGALGASANASKKIGDIQTIIERFNLMCNWIASEIVLTTNTTTRAFLISKIIRLAFKCYRIYNFQTVTQLVHALQSPYVERLKRTWQRIPAYEMRLFSTLKYFCSHLKNFKLLREATESLAGQWGPPGQDNEEPKTLLGVPGAMPFFGLILRDLAVHSELPTYLDPSSPRAPAVLDPDTGLLREYADSQVFDDLPETPKDLPLRPLINVHKYRSIANVITKVLTFKELAQTYPYEPDLHTYRKCLTLHCLTPQLIAQLSSACEKP